MSAWVKSTDRGWYILGYYRPFSPGLAEYRKGFDTCMNLLKINVGQYYNGDSIAQIKLSWRIYLRSNTLQIIIRMRRFQKQAPKGCSRLISEGAITFIHLRSKLFSFKTSIIYVFCENDYMKCPPPPPFSVSAASSNIKNFRSLCSKLVLVLVNKPLKAVFNP